MAEELDARVEAAQLGMLWSYWAERQPGVTALFTEAGDRTFAEVNANGLTVLAEKAA